MLNKEELENLILVEQLSYEEIGRKYGMTGAGIKKKAKSLGVFLPIRRSINPSEWASFSHRKYPDVICPICGKSFMRKSKEQVYCSIECSAKHLREIPKKHKEKPIWDGIERKNMWKYSQVVDNHGYLYAMCPQHPKALKNGYIYLHRLIVENHLGRLLKDDEVIHHKDLNKKNNSIDNLMVLTSSKHSKLHWQIKRNKV